MTKKTAPKVVTVTTHKASRVIAPKAPAPKVAKQPAPKAKPTPTPKASKEPAQLNARSIRDAAKRAAARANKRPVVVVDVRTMGRPTSYRPEFAGLVYNYSLLGASHERMAELLGVAVSTFEKWKGEHPNFSEALIEGKDNADARVAQSLYHRALGYSHPEVDIKVVNGVIVQTPITKQYPPDTGAATLWLKNRQPHLWRDKVENVVTGADGGPIQTNMTIEFVRTGK